MIGHARAWAVGVALVLLLGSVRGAAADDWLGADKALHASLSAGLAMGGYGTAAQAWPCSRTATRVAFGGGVALTAGLAKEGWDLAGHGDPSGKDLAWDAIGSAGGLLVAWAIDRIFF